MTIAVIRIAPDGGTSFDDLDVPLAEAAFAPPAEPFLVGAPAPAERYLLFEMPPGWVGEWHPAPRRQLAVILAGELEVEVGTGERRSFGAGGCVLLEDVTGVGHRTRVVGGSPARGLFVQLPPEG